MKKLLFTFLAVMCCMAMNAQTTTFEVGGIKYSVTGENTVEVVANGIISKYTGDVVIPSTVTSDGITYDVTRIGNKAFYFCADLASITIPASVNSIGTDAFMSCQSLTSITIPENVNSIGTGAFTICKGLASITVAEENTIYESPDNCNAIIEKSTHTLLWGCKNTVIPNTVTSINNDAFRMHTGLTSITIPEGVTSIGNGAFWSTGLKSVTIGKSVKTIGDNAFKNCTDMTEIDVLATTPPTLGTEAFYLVAKDIPVYVPDVETYTGWGEFTNLIYVDLATPKKEAIADLQTFINKEKIVNAPMEEYESRINAASTPKDLSNIVESIYAEISNSDQISIGDRKYLLDDGAIIGGEMAITDKGAFTSNYEVDVDELTYARTFSSTDWQALYVPFSMTYDDWKDYMDVYDIYNVLAYDEDNDGVIERTTVNMIRLKEGAVTEPNYPYVIRAKNKGAVEITLEGATLYPAEENSIDCTSTKQKFTFTGNYKKLTGLYTKGSYALQGGVLKTAINDDVELNPQRWYMDVTNRNGSPAAATRVYLNAFGEESEVEGVKGVAVNIIGEETTYDLGGRTVNANQLPKGLYVRGGKKFIVR